MLAAENSALCIGRAGQVVGPDAWNVAFCSGEIEDFNLFYRGGSLDLPLYLHREADDRAALRDSRPPREQEPNLSRHHMAALASAHGRQPLPEAVFRYVYAVLYAPAYRENYAEFLKTDFPRIPFTADAELFHQLAGLGERLVALHLLNSPELDPPAARFLGEGDSRVARTGDQGFRYDPKDQRVYINKTQYFGPVRQELWGYRIGGYQVLDKWLKDRKGTDLGTEEVRTYCRIVTAIGKTIELQEQIDALYPEVESRIVSFQ